MNNPFLQIGIVFVLAATLGLVARLLKQPLILAYILVGLALSFFGIGSKVAGETLDLLSQFGIAFLLFMVGMELKVADLKQVGKSVLIVGLGQVILTFLAGLLISLALGFSTLVSFYLGLALTFSSTIIVVKLLSEQNGLDSLSGKVTVGILLIQDLVAICVLMLLSGFRTQTSPDLTALLLIFTKGLMFIFAVSFLAKKAIPIIFQTSARSQELLFLLAVSWCFFLASVSLLLGFSLAIGAFLAGVSLSTLPYHYQISARIKPLRDLFITLFFAGLGMQMVLTPMVSLLWPVLVLVLFVLLFKPLIVMLLMGFLGFRKRTSFLTAASLGQISEFSLILIAAGQSLQHLTSPEASLVTVASLLTIVLSTYFIVGREQLYARLTRVLSLLEKKQVSEKRIKVEKPLEDHIVLVGCNRMGGDILEFLKSKEKPFLVLDFNPETIRLLEAKEVPCLFGDVSDEEILEQLNLGKAKLVISTVPTLEDNLALITKTKTKNSKAVILVTASFPEDEEELYNAGADYVILPHLLGGQHVAHILSDHGHELGSYLSSKRKKTS